MSAEVEPAIKLSREIIEELREDIQGLQNSNKDLQDDNRELRDNNRELENTNRELTDRNKTLHQELESAFRGFVRASKIEGKTTEETVNSLMKIFSIKKSNAEKKVRAYWTEA